MNEMTKPRTAESVPHPNGDGYGDAVPFNRTRICITVVGEFLLKAGVNQVGEFSLALPVLWKTFTEWRVILGFAMVFAGSLFWLGVISRTDFSYAYPLLALSYVISLIPARFFLHEDVTWNRVLGSLIIVLGVIVVTWRVK